MERHAPTTPADHRIEIAVSFGDCDPAGIVFYPNFFRWFDRCFHDFMHVRAGGHSALCDRLGSAGIGLMDAGAAFRGPITQNQPLHLEMWLERWSARSLRLAYRGSSGDRLVVEGHELRGVFVMRDGAMRAAEVGALRAALTEGPGSEL